MSIDLALVKIKPVNMIKTCWLNYVMNVN